MIKLGLIGYPLGHSFSKTYYLDKFEKENIKGIDYDLYPIPSISEFCELYSNDSDFRGFNVTIPYKQDVLPLITEFSEEAKEIQAVNCITINRDNGQIKLKGHNTDVYGFRKSIEPLLQPQHKKALVLGNGGAAKAVFFALKQLQIPYAIVSRSKENGDYTYDELSKEIIEDYTIIINCSPIGTYPNIENCPNIPYEYISNNHLLYDLIYNPVETLFLQKGKANGAAIKNGYEMLVLQAEKNWEIWSENF